MRWFVPLVLVIGMGAMAPNPLPVAESERVTDRRIPAPLPAPLTAAPAPSPPPAPPAEVDTRPPLGEESAPQANQVSDLSDALDDALTAWAAKDASVRAIAAAVARPGADDIIWVGSAAQPGTEAIDVNAGYAILSVTKTFTEALVLREVAAGRLDLDRSVPPIDGVVTGPGVAEITPRMLLQHTSGLVHYQNAAGYDPAAPISPQTVVSLATHSPLLAEPGTTVHYSNTNYHWLGLLLESVTGRSYGDLIAGLATDHGLTTTALDPTGRPGWVGYASGGIRSTVGDVARWGARLFSPGAVLPERQLSALLTVGPLDIGLGLFPFCPCDDDGDPVAMGQIAGDGGLFHYTADGLVIAVRIEMAPDAGIAPSDQVSLALRDAVAAASVGAEPAT